MVRTIVILVIFVLFQIGIIFFILKKNLRQKKELKEAKEKINNLELKNEEYNRIHKETLEEQKKYRGGDSKSNFNASIDFLLNNTNRKKT